MGVVACQRVGCTLSLRPTLHLDVASDQPFSNVGRWKGVFPWGWVCCAIQGK